MGARAATSTLIKQNDPPHIGVEIAPHRWATAATGATMQHNHRRAFRVATLLYIDAVPLAYL